MSVTRPYVIVTDLYSDNQSVAKNDADSVTDSVTDNVTDNDTDVTDKSTAEKRREEMLRLMKCLL